MIIKLINAAKTPELVCLMQVATIRPRHDALGTVVMFANGSQYLYRESFEEVEKLIADNLGVKL